MKFSTIISGYARGAYTIAKKYAREFGKIILNFKSKLGFKYGTRGYLRNVDIVKNSGSQFFAFMDGVSRGTNHSIRIANRFCYLE